MSSKRVWHVDLESRCDELPEIQQKLLLATEKVCTQIWFQGLYIRLGGHYCISLNIILPLVEGSLYQEVAMPAKIKAEAWDLQEYRWAKGTDLSDLFEHKANVRMAGDKRAGNSAVLAFVLVTAGNLPGGPESVSIFRVSPSPLFAQLSHRRLFDISWLLPAAAWTPHMLSAGKTLIALKRIWNWQGETVIAGAVYIGCAKGCRAFHSSGNHSAIWFWRTTADGHGRRIGSGLAENCRCSLHCWTGTAIAPPIPLSHRCSTTQREKIEAAKIPSLLFWRPWAD